MDNIIQSKTKYKLKKVPIGKGSFSTVYYATDSLGNEYAIKKISLENLEPSRLAKFMQELDISTQMIHENIVKCNEVFKTEKYWYIVTEYCNYGTFADLIMALTGIEPKQRENLCHYYLNQLKNALHYLNTNNIIHRDLKPQNILLTKDKNKNNEIVVKLADFGFSRYISQGNINSNSDDMDATICGTPMYMAPELLLDGRYNKKADLWSYGVIMYELLYGTNPYNYPKNLNHLTHLIKQQKVMYNNDFSDKCINLVQRLLAVSPENRITWEEFFDHQWFKNVPLLEKINVPDENLEDSMTDAVFELLDESTPVIASKPDVKLMPRIAPKFTNDFNYAQKYSGPDVPAPPIGKPVKSSDKLDDFVIVEKRDDGTEIASPIRPTVQNYKEVTTSTIIQIMFDSVGYLFGQKGY